MTTGSNVAWRVYPTATLLSDGTVLVAGGQGINDSEESVFWASAEVYDPDDGTWTATGSMAEGRVFHSATLLRDGRVLVAGGLVAAADFTTRLVGSEVYDPATGSWTTTGDMVERRVGHTATLLGDGSVLVAGGGTGVQGPGGMSSAELYDADTGTWSPLPDMAGARSEHTATLLVDGRVLVAGGAGCCGNLVPSAEIYDPGTRTWTSAGRMSVARAEHSETLLHDGRVVVAGGRGDQPDPGGWIASTEVFDPSDGMWTQVGAMGMARGTHTATLLSDGTVLVFGGWGGQPSALGAPEKYDPVLGQWDWAPPTDWGRADHTATALPDGRVLVAGGYYSGIGDRINAYLYLPTESP